eukprot:5882633-Prymnesium_polylepis.1
MMTPEQMQMQMQMMQMMQQMAQQQTAAVGQPHAQPSAAAPAPSVKACIVLVSTSKDGELELTDGQRTTVPIKVELNAAQEPTG